jgi:hypothetical protein
LLSSVRLYYKSETSLSQVDSITSRMLVTMRVYSEREGQVGMVVIPRSTTNHRYTREALMPKVACLDVDLLTALGRLSRR